MGRIRHRFTCAILDDPAAYAAGEVLPSNWNEDHIIELTEEDLVYTDPDHPTRHFTQSIKIRNAGQVDEYIETLWTELP